MTSHIKFYVITKDESRLYSLFECEDTTPLNIYRDAVNIIKELKSQGNLTYAHFHNQLISLHNYEIMTNYANMYVEYIVSLIYDCANHTLICHAQKSDNPRYVFYNRYMFGDMFEGNCIDEFIYRGVNPQIDNINDLINSIKCRLPERENAIEYHSTPCYEHDFTEITLIKQCAQKIVDNCNKHLEQITEFYTKLNEL